MTEQERAELAKLREQQARLEQELHRLSAQLKSFEQRLDSPGGEPATSPQPSAAAGQPTTTPTCPSKPSQPPPIPPVIRLPRPAPIRVSPPVPAPRSAPVPVFSATAQISPPNPAPAPAPAGPVPVPPRLRVREREQVASAGQNRDDSFAGATTPPPGSPDSQPPTGAAEVPSFELRLGTYWLVRVGIVMVVTGLVFFGNLAYQNYISRLGPGGKITLLYLASAVLLGAGWWWQRQAAKEGLRNYGQVLFAGGWAAMYFTTYAAYHIERLRVIQSPLSDGFLLLLCAGWMVWVADRKKSEVMALFAVGLAYYTSIITRVGYFTLYSNLLLTLAAVAFLVRNRWAVLSFGSLAASYAAYGFWRFFDGASWHWASPAEGLWSGTYFLIAYWVVFSSAVFLSKSERLAGEERATFLTLNNGAFFTMFLLTMLQVREGGFWKFALVYGSVLLGLAEAARRKLQSEPLTRNAYLTQGLLLVTVGLISRFAGLQLALILAAESIVLLLMSYQRENLVLRVAAYIAAGLAVGWGMDGMRQSDPQGLWLAIGLGGLMVVNAVIVHRRTLSDTQLSLRPQVSYFGVLALLIWLVTTWNNTARENFPLMLALEALVLTFSIYALGVREFGLLGQGYLVLAQVVWFWNWFDLTLAMPWWNPALMIGVSLALSHWWQAQRTVQLPQETAIAWQVLFGLAIVGLLYCWLSPKVQTPYWLVVTGGLALALTVYGVQTRAWYVAACGQVFVGVSALQFVLQLTQAKPGWPFALAPIAALGALSWGTWDWFRNRPEADAKIRDPLLSIALAYRWVALAMSITWICEYIPARERIWLLALVGLWIFLWAGLKRSREALLMSAPFTATALCLFWLPLLEAPTVYWPNLVAIVVLLGQRQMARRLPDRYPLGPEVHGAIIVAGGLSLWLFVSRLVLEQASGFYLTASWSLLALALFTCGIALRERVYRWLGLGILACALGRVIVFDVWKLETLYRILSFMALGIVLLVLGFIYNKYQEKIREWL